MSRIPVTDENGKLFGMVSMGDIATELANALEDVSKESSFWWELLR